MFVVVVLGGGGGFNYSFTSLLREIERPSLEERRWHTGLGSALQHCRHQLSRRPSTTHTEGQEEHSACVRRSSEATQSYAPPPIPCESRTDIFLLPSVRTFSLKSLQAPFSCSLQDLQTVPTALQIPGWHVNYTNPFCWFPCPQTRLKPWACTKSMAQLPQAMEQAGDGYRIPPGESMG